MNDEIFDLIKKENFKQCFEKINILKRQYPNSSYFKVLELYAKYWQSPTKFNYDESLGNIYGPKGSLIISDLSTLNLLHKFFFELGKYDEALQIYERANFKYPSYNSALKWFSSSLGDSNFRQAIRASHKLAKLSGNNQETLTSRDYFFWYALSILAFFRFQNDQITEQESKLLPQLAYRTLSNVKPFQSTQEVTVFCSVCAELFPSDMEKSQEIVQEILPLLDSSLDLYLKNFLLEHIQDDNYETMLEICCKILKKIDDYELISQLIKSGYHLGKSKKYVLEKIALLVGDSRNSRLSHLESDIVFDGEISESSLLHYLSKFHDKPCCAVDIKRYRDSIDTGTLKLVMSKLDNGSVIHDTNAYQLKITELDSKYLYNKNKDSLKSKSKTDYSTCSIFILNIVESVLATKLDGPPLEDVLLALTILENYQKLDPHNYDTAVWIILLYMHLGCVPLAHSHFLELKTKNMQIDTLDFLLYSRYSTLFPSKDNDYLRSLHSTHDRLYGSSRKRLSQFIQIALERKSYSKVLGMIDFKDRLQRSSMKWMMACEQLQLARLCNDKRGELLQSMRDDLSMLRAGGNISLSDNRDWSIFGANVSKSSLPSTLDVLDITEKAIDMNCIKEFIIEVIPTRQIDHKLDALLEEALAGSELQTVLKSCFDDSSRWSFNVFYDLYKNDGANLKQYIQKIKTDALFVSTWKLSHRYLISLQTLKTLENFKRIKDPETKKLIKAKITDLRNSCDDYYAAYASDLSKAYNTLSTGESAKTLRSLDYVMMDFDSLKNGIITVQKTVRNL